MHSIHSQYFILAYVAARCQFKHFHLILPKESSGQIAQGDEKLTGVGCRWFSSSLATSGFTVEEKDKSRESHQDKYLRELVS